jgi:hypothetical protein
VHHFLQEHLLHWLEALGWMQKVSEGIYAIISLESITTVASFQYDTNIQLTLGFRRVAVRN